MLFTEVKFPGSTQQRVRPTPEKRSVGTRQSSSNNVPQGGFAIMTFQAICGINISRITYYITRCFTSKSSYR